MGRVRGTGLEEWGWEASWGCFAPPAQSCKSLRIPREKHKVLSFPWKHVVETRVFVLLPCMYDLGKALNTNQMKAVPAGAWEQGAAPGACGWVTLCNYNTAVKAPEPRVAAGGVCWLPICSASFGSEWISSVWVGAYCCVCFSSPSRLFSLPGLSACSGAVRVPPGRENCEVAII